MENYSRYWHASKSITMRNAAPKMKIGKRKKKRAQNHEKGISD